MQQIVDEATHDNQEEEEEEEAPENILLKENYQASDMRFHPFRDVLGVSLVSGAVQLFNYSLQGNSALLELNHHKSSCRCLSFSDDGQYLFTGSVDQSLAAIDMNTGNIIFQKENAHNDSLNSMLVMQNMLATGDEEGGIKVWDLRQSKQAFFWEEHEDFISDFAFQPPENMLLATSGDGSLSVFNLRKGKLEAMSDNIEDELLSIAIMKNGRKVVCGTQDGILDIWTWDYWGDISDRFPGHPQSVDALVVVDQDTLCTGSSDGIIRVVSILPNQMLGLVGEHGDMPIECMRVSRDKKYMTTSSHDNIIKFWNVAYLFSSDNDDNNNNNNNNNDNAEQIEEGPSSMETTKADEAHTTTFTNSTAITSTQQQQQNNNSTSAKKRKKKKGRKNKPIA